MEGRRKKSKYFLLKCQIDVVLKGLELLAEEVNKKYNYRKVSLTKEENSEK